MDGLNTAITACRGCGSTDLFPVLDLGEQPLANAFRHADDPTPERRFPLAVVACASCTLAQLTVTVEPHEMFTEYPYFSSYSTSFVAAARRLAARTSASQHLDRRDLVVEIGSNDGYLLRHYLASGAQVLGVEPAANVATVAENAGVDTRVDYFSAAVATAIRDEHGPAQVMHANNVMAHIADIHGLIRGIAILLADDGIAFIESPYLIDLVEHCEFDTIYHEHLLYFSVSAVAGLMRAHDLEVVSAERLPVHGGSVRYGIRHSPATSEPSVGQLIEHERACGIGTPVFYANFAEQVEQVRHDFAKVLRQRKDSGQTIAGYGAAAKATVLLNACGVGPDLLPYVVDRNVRKHGLLMPGVMISIEDPAVLAERQPEALVLLAWNLAAEIIEQQRAYQKAGGTFIIPIPQVRTLEP
jgi:SAM-dependent methyltransferase